MKELQSTGDVVNIIENQGVIMFTTPKCETCVALKLKLEAAGIEIPVFELQSGDNYPAPQFGIKNVPTVVAFKQGQEIMRLNGSQDAAMYKRLQDVPDMSIEELEQFSKIVAGTKLTGQELDQIPVDAEEVKGEVITMAEIEEKFKTASNNFHAATEDKYNTPDMDEKYLELYNEHYEAPLKNWIYNLANGIKAGS